MFRAMVLPLCSHSIESSARRAVNLRMKAMDLLDATCGDDDATRHDPQRSMDENTLRVEHAFQAQAKLSLPAYRIHKTRWHTVRR